MPCESTGPVIRPASEPKPICDELQTEIIEQSQQSQQWASGYIITLCGILRNSHLPETQNMGQDEILHEVLPAIAVLSIKAMARTPWSL